MSAPPILSGQPVQRKYRLSPSFEMDAPCSIAAVLTGAPRVTGADQAEKRGASSGACRDASRPPVAGDADVPVESPPQAARPSAMRSRDRCRARFIQPPYWVRTLLKTLRPIRRLRDGSQQRFGVRTARGSHTASQVAEIRSLPGRVKIGRRPYGMDANSIDRCSPR